MNKPKLFDLVKVWNDEKDIFVIGCYLEKDRHQHLVHIGVSSAIFSHAVKIPHELAEQLGKLDEVAV